MFNWLFYSVALDNFLLNNRFKKYLGGGGVLGAKGQDVGICRCAVPDTTVLERSGRKADG